MENHRVIFFFVSSQLMHRVQVMTEMVTGFVFFLQTPFIDAAVMPPFKVLSDPRNEWIKWKRAFERFTKANKIEDNNEKHDLLLVLGGLELQSYFDKITKWQVIAPANDGTEDTIVLQYESAIVSLDKYFAPQTNKRFERHILRGIKQDDDEAFEEYIFRLKDQANRCIFMDTDDAVVDQVIEGCRSSELRKKLLSEDLTLSEAITLGKTLEEVQKQTKLYDKPSSSYTAGVVQRMSGKYTPRNNNAQSSRRCYNCNQSGHMARDIDKCAARNVICHGCKSKGHFVICCRKRKREVTQTHDQPVRKRVNAITSGETTDRVADRTVFFVGTHQELEEVLTLDVGGVSINLLIDSGSPANIINSTTFEHLKNQQAMMINQKNPGERVNLKAFASDQKINFDVVFETEVKIPGEDSGVWAHFLVAPKGQTNLLSKSTAFALGVLRIGYAVNHMSQEHMAKERMEFPKVPDVSLQIQVDTTVQPLVQVARRLPVTMEADVEETILELLEKKIIERAEGPLTWVSPLVPVRKADGRIRLCVDMRAANKAVKRENYPMPNIDDAMISISQVRIIS